MIIESTSPASTVSREVSSQTFPHLHLHLTTPSTNCRKVCKLLVVTAPHTISDRHAASNRSLPFPAGLFHASVRCLASGDGTGQRILIHPIAYHLQRCRAHEYLIRANSTSLVLHRLIES